MQLYKLVALIRSRKKRRAFKLRSSSNQEAKENPIVSLDRFKTEEALDNYLFNNFYRTKAFKIKKNIKKQLLLDLLHIDFDDNKLNRAVRTETKLSLKLVQANVLIRFRFREMGIDLLNEIVREAQLFHFTKILKEAYGMLRTRMALLGEPRKFDHYHQLWNEMKDIEAVEDEIEYLHFFFKSRAQRSVRQLMSNKIERDNHFQRALELKRQYDTPRINKYYSEIIYQYFMRNAHWQKCLEYINELEENMKSNPDKYILVRKSNLNIMKAYALLLLAKLEEGKAFIESVLHEYRKDENSYFILMEDYIIISLRLGQFQNALKLAKEVITTPSFKNEQVFTKERWQVYQLYAQYFNNELLGKRPDFENIFSVYTKDKEGFNLHILFLQILVLIKNEEYELLTRRLEALKMYQIRQISKSTNRRAQYFMRMLFHLETYALDYEQCKLSGKKYYDLLLRFPESEQPYTEVELIPYEQIWQHILEILESRAVKSYRVGVR